MPNCALAGPQPMSARDGVSLHTYQSALAFVFDARDSVNHGCLSDVSFSTRSIITRMPRACAAAMNASKAAMSP